MLLDIVRCKDTADQGMKCAFARLLPGTVCVVIDRGEYVVVYYEGGFYDGHPHDQVPPLKKRIEYAKIAAGRAYKKYPTVALFGLSHEQAKHLEPCGVVDTDTWEVRMD